MDIIVSYHMWPHHPAERMQRCVCVCVCVCAHNNCEQYCLSVVVIIEELQGSVVVVAVVCGVFAFTNV